MAVASPLSGDRCSGHAQHPRRPCPGRNRVKRGGGVRHDTLSEADDVASEATESERILDLDTALNQLAEENPRHARIVECRFFGGMTIEETAIVLDVSTATVKRDWMALRGWLQRELESHP